MTCAAGAPTFRLLDAHVGWDETKVEQLVGLADEAGVRLRPLPAPGGVEAADVDRFLPPPNLAFDRRHCTWYLATPSPPRVRLLVMTLCDGCDRPWRRLAVDPDRHPSRVADLAAGHRLVAAVEPGGTLWVFAADGRLVGESAVPAPRAVAIASPCELLVAAARGERLLRFDPAGTLLGEHPAAPPDEPIERLAFDDGGSLWLLTRRPGGDLALWRDAGRGGGFEAADVAALAAAFPDLGLVADRNGFSFVRGGERCPFDGFGRPGDGPDPAAPPRQLFEHRGQLLSGPIDSGRPRCRWHRVRIDADVPEGCSIELAVVASESPAPPDQGVAAGAWAAFTPGLPHPDDWRGVPGSLDFLVDQPPGRYLFVRLRLSGDGTATPAVRRVRLDLPRSTSLAHLPAVYREEPVAEDFGERFLSLFDAALEDLDRAIERLPALFDTAGVPDEALPWLGHFLDAVFDPAWDGERRRAVLAALPALYPRRGTIGGLAAAIRLVFDADPVIEELADGLPWGAVADGRDDDSPLAGRLGSLRLFSRSRSRFRAGLSPLASAPLRSHGDPDLDPLTAGAYRFRVHLPAAVVPDAAALGRLRRLVESQKPAHTVASVAVGATALVLAGRVGVGIDTRLSTPDSPPLGEGLALGTNAILGGGGERHRLESDRTTVGDHC